MKHTLPVFALTALATSSCMTGIPAAVPSIPTGVAAVQGTFEVSQTSKVSRSL